MMFLKRLAVLFYVSLTLFLSAFLILFVLNWVNYYDVTFMLSTIYSDQNLRLIIGCMAAVFLVINFLFYQFYSVNVHRDKIIAFDNPSGRVTVSLVAMEDIVRRMLTRLPEIKKVYPNITASKKGLTISVKLSLQSEVNIPELSASVQGRIKRKIQDMIGIDQPLDITVYIGRIVSESAKSKDAKNQPPIDDEAVPPVPFHGYRA